jgi:hypothetical protein
MRSKAVSLNVSSLIALVLPGVILGGLALVLSVGMVAGKVRAEPSVPPAAPEAGAPSVVSYQGRVTVDGAAFSGQGFFKFALVNGTGTTTYWSNDGTSSGGDEPTNGTPLPVSNGLFTVLLGDTSLTT